MSSSRLATITRLKESDATAKATVTLSTVGGVWELNGLTYDSSRIDLTSKLNAVTIWTLTNNSPVMHPFHKHLSEFNVLDANGQDDNMVIVKETYVDYLGQETTKDVEMRMRRNEGG